MLPGSLDTTYAEFANTEFNGMFPSKTASEYYYCTGNARFNSNWNPTECVSREPFVEGNTSKLKDESLNSNLRPLNWPGSARATTEVSLRLEFV